ncbi:sulfatase-like hydrolase/transferase [Croceivirga sp. JEA036]|uniref:sulfatase-like hydrolase/transferase n=1 Tax=Croceivirga sp. JEA036 TaxID=2721162 RepID=UPI00143A61D4|nr:sulfatase-like hydrolase/transferase [Croceivirga sp. JEA036]NJB35198.1 sulfatase-like hydrolase/transferase [Croceivirga sp. JEA036]
MLQKLNCTLLVFGMFLLSVNAQEQPNFIFILTDDQQYGMMGCTGNTIVQTPNLDQLAEDGVLFTNAHVTSAICTPSRASILTSQFERKHGINFNSGTSMSPEGWANTYPVVMRNNGYYTGWVGKNHVPVGEGGYMSGLMEKSFDYWYAGHGHLSFYPKDRHKIFEDAESDTQVEVIGEGITDFLSNEQKLKGAITFLDKRPADKPFMLSVCFNLPHGNGTSSMQQRESDDEIYKSLYRDKDLPLPEHYVAKADIKTPKLPESIHRAYDRQTGYDYVDMPETLKERYTRQLQAMTGIDRLVGHLRTTLKKQGLDKNTVIIFTSDHGLFMGQFGLGGKAFCYEQTTHVPMIVYNPAEKKKKRGINSDALVQSIDLAPTMLSLAGITAPTTYQGKDLSKLLAGKSSEVRDYLYTENLWSTQFGNPRCEAVQNKEWKYIRYYKNETFSAKKKIKAAQALGVNVNKMLYKVNDIDLAQYRAFVEDPLQWEKPVYEELYYLATDPKETTNLAAKTAYQDKLKDMRSIWAKEIKNARGTEPPMVLRYTADSEAEKGKIIQPK